MAALQERGRMLSRADLFDVTVTAAALPPLPLAVETAAYRIAVEGVTNAARHAAARHCWVDVLVDQTLQLTVRDDGRGLGDPPFRVGPAPGVGLASIRTRTAELGGEMAIDSAPGQGTCLQVRLPIQGRA